VAGFQLFDLLIFVVEIAVVNIMFVVVCGVEIEVLGLFPDVVGVVFVVVADDVIVFFDLAADVVVLFVSVAVEQFRYVQWGFEEHSDV
jgi:hypothetical protein